MLKIRDLHNFPLQESVPHFSKDLEDRIVEDDMIVLDFVKICDKLVDLLFAYLKPVV